MVIQSATLPAQAIRIRRVTLERAEALEAIQPPLLFAGYLLDACRE